MKKKSLLTLLLVLSMSISLCACGSSKNESVEIKEEEVETEEVKEETEEVKEEEEENSALVDSIDFTLDGGTIKYVGVEKASYDLVERDDVVIVKFEFTNYQDIPRSCSYVFYNRYFQNSVECETAISWTVNGTEQSTLCDNYFTEVMKDGTLILGQLVQNTDNSPITVMVSDFADLNNYQMMEIDLASEFGETTMVESTEEATANDEEAGTDSDVKTIQAGDKIETEYFDFVLNKVELTYELKPSNTSSMYTSYEAAQGNVYIHIDGHYTNKGKTDVTIGDLFIPSADYDNGYKYDGFAVIDDGDNSFDWVSSYVACTPLNTCHYHGLIECPKVIDETDAPLYITFEADGTTYRYDIR